MSRRGGRPTEPTGLLVVDKPTGPTSMDVVRRVRRAVGGVKCGHAGTLDPLATGVVICCLGRATRAAERLMSLTKVYEAGVDLSAFTATDDREGKREPVEIVSPPTPDAVRSAGEAMIGEIEQAPPAYSAVHVAGRRAYEHARRGEPVKPASRPVRVHHLELQAYDWPLAWLRVTCGKGVYIRSLARDLGHALGTGGSLASLRRTAVGDYTLARAVNLERCEQPLTAADLLPLPGV